MKSKEAVLEALNKGINLVSSVTGLQYTLINGTLHTRHSERTDWNQSNLSFSSPPSWLNLKTIEKQSDPS